MERKEKEICKQHNITIKDLKVAHENFKIKEWRSPFYEKSKTLVEKGFIVEGVYLLMATWNSANYRYQNGLDFESFEEKINTVKKEISELKGTLKTIHLMENKDSIIRAYNTLASEKMISHTGASKVLHLLNPDVFVMWDGYIRGRKSRRYYNGLLFYKRFEESGEGYLEFLQCMQSNYKEIDTGKEIKTKLPKLIDEFNYINITLPIQEKEKKEKEEKKEKKTSK